jgi:hypothetical protein
MKWLHFLCNLKRKLTCPVETYVSVRVIYILVYTSKSYYENLPLEE